MSEQKYVVDTSVVIEKAVSKLIKEKKIEGTILLPKAVLAELEHQANQGKETGFLGLEELQTLQKLKQEEKIELFFLGDRPNALQIKYAKEGGEIDSLIKDIAYNEGAILITADKVQNEAAKAIGLKTIYLAPTTIKTELQIDAFLDQHTMSLHMKEGCIPQGKKGKPGEWNLVNVSEKELSTEQVQNMAKEIVERSRSERDAFIEISRPGSTVVQYKDKRIVITKPPVSDGWEITVVRPLVQLDIEKYNLPEKIAARVKTEARGVLIAGETGSGKSTFAQALAEYYAKNNNIVKTIESPRDLILSKSITQYSKNLASGEEIHDILFLSRPDYIIFDEMRDTPDFNLYADLRLGGSNCLGVMHAATAIDSVKRFISRLDVGVIPSVVDTIIFIEKGSVGKILTLQIMVKVPTGMTEADLARPVIEVRDFLSSKLEYEIYSYGEQTVIIPVNEDMQFNAAHHLAAKQIEAEFEKYSKRVKAKMINNSKVEVYLPKENIGEVIGKQGRNIERLEKKLGFKIDVRELDNLSPEEKEKKIVNYEIRESGKAILLLVSPQHAGEEADILIEKRFILSAFVGKKGEIHINKKSKQGKTLERDIKEQRDIEVFI